MKQYILKLFSLLLIISATFGGVSCKDDFELPPLVIPEATKTPNTSIAMLKQAYWKSDRNYVETIGLTQGGKHTIIGGRVISSDEAGNIYQNLVIKDDSGEAITIAVKTSSSWKLYMSCRLGAEIVMDVTDLKIGAYNGLIQIGAEGTYNGAPSMTFMSEDTFKAHFEADGLGNPDAVQPVEVSLADLQTAKSSAEGLLKWQSQLVRINQVYFQDAGQPFAIATENNTNRYVLDAQGNKLIVRNSSHSNFADQLLPQGYGDIIGILSYFGTDWQMYLINEEGCVDFTGQPVVTPGTGDAIFTESFQSSIGDFTIQNITMNDPITYIWSHDASYKCMKASAYKDGVSYPSKSLLVSPVIDLSKSSAPTLSFDHALAKFPDIDFAKANCVILVKEENATEWSALPGVAYPASLSWTFIPSGNVSLAQYAGKKIRFAFSYSSETDKSGTWEVKNVVIR